MNKKGQDKEEWRTGIIVGLLVAAVMLAKIIL